jgi:FAD:protein FMN transferase
LIPAGTALDVGGIGKGWIAARGAALLTRLSDDPALLLDAGGDLVAVTGEHVVVVEGPDETCVRLGDGQAVATSGYGRRQWVNGDGRSAHHLIDPATGAPGARTHATVLAEGPVAADVMAKVLALRPALVETTSYAALVRTPQGRAASHTWPQAPQQQ